MLSNTKIRLSDHTIRTLCGMAFPNYTVGTITELTDGWFNASFAITFCEEDGSDVVLKAGPPPDIPIMRYERDILRTEIAALQYFEDSPGIRVPKIHYVDLSRSTIVSEFYIMEKLPGEPWNRMRSVLSESENIHLETALGEIHRNLNKRRSATFGLYSDTHPRFDTWFGAFTYLLNLQLQDAERFGVTLPVSTHDIRQNLHAAKRVFDMVKIPCFIHWDLWEGNTFVQKVDGHPEFSGIIDFERALFADPLMEYWYTRDSIDDFAAGYGRNLMIEDGSVLRRAFYDLYLHIIMVVEDGPRDYDNKEPVKRATREMINDMDVICREIACLPL